jgi:hypothetical protein
MADKRRVIAIPKTGETGVKQVPHEDRKHNEEKYINGGSFYVQSEIIFK